MTTFQLTAGARGASFWPRFFVEGKGGVLLNRAKLRELRDSGVKWLGLTWMDAWWEDSYKTTKLSDPSHLINVIEDANAYGLRTVLRLAFWKQTREQAFAGTLLRPMDGVILSAARVMKHVSKTMNAFQPVHEWGLVGDTFTQDALQSATVFVDGFYDALGPQIRAVCPDLTVCLSAPGWSKFGGDERLMKPRPNENILRNIEYTTQAAQAKAWYASRGEACIMTEGFAEHVQAGLSAGIASAEWREG